MLYVCGYISYKIARTIKCKYCIDVVVNNSETNDNYFKSINRGGLSVPTDFLIGISKHVLGIMQTLMSNEFEDLFLSSSNHKQIVCKLANIAIQNDNSLPIDNKCFKCGFKYEAFAADAVSRMSNVVLNNYTKIRNDHLNAVKNNKRKVAILS